MSEMVTMSAAAAHNAVAALVQMYAGIMLDQQRELQMMRAQLEDARQQLQQAGAAVARLEGIVRDGADASARAAARIGELQRELDRARGVQIGSPDRLT